MRVRPNRFDAPGEGNVCPRVCLPSHTQKAFRVNVMKFEIVRGVRMAGLQHKSGTFVELGEKQAKPLVLQEFCVKTACFCNMVR